ncbi:MAG: protein arginine kinase [Candidatus Aureabacteria bacterium]|nr:protein arginine kinase [Candidatus Auribacterota bacterium]
MISILLNKNSEWLMGDGPEVDYVMSTRIRLARNIAGYPFPRKLAIENKNQIVKMSEAVFSSSKLLSSDALLINMHEIDEIDRQFLMERHLISPEMVSLGEGSAVAISKEENLSVMLNEEDHLRIQVLKSGLQLKEVWTMASSIDDELDKGLPYAFSGRFGYLTACPTNVGTGIRVSVMMHLPGLVYSKQINKILQAAMKLGLAVRGLYGEGSEALGNLFQISNQSSLGIHEQDIIKNLKKIIDQVITHEKNARMFLLNNSLRQLEDKVGRSFGILRNARIISSKESIGLFSTLRMGIDLGLINDIPRSIINQLFIITQPAHLQRYFEKILDTGERDVKRANLIREKLKGLH